MVDKDGALERWDERRVLLDCGPLKGRRFDIIYETGGGDLSGRRVRVESLSHVDGALYVEAFCFLRNEHRTFAIEGLRHVVDCETGMVFGGGERWLEYAGLWRPDGEPRIDCLGQGTDSSRQFQVLLNMPLPVVGDRPARTDQCAALHADFGLMDAAQLGEKQAAALLAWWDYAGALIRLMPASDRKGPFNEEIQFRSMITAVISTLPEASADIALWSVRRCHRPINPETIPKMSHFQTVGDAMLKTMRRLVGQG